MAGSRDTSKGGGGSGGAGGSVLSSEARRLGAGVPDDSFRVAIGVVESKSIARGLEVTDAVMKVAPVDVLWARTVSGGRFVTLFTGDVEEVVSALERGHVVAGQDLWDELLVPNLHPQVVPVVSGARRDSAVDAVGVVETLSVAAAIDAADRAAKEAAVTLVELRLAMHMGGKAFVSLTGEVSDVEASVLAGAAAARAHGMLAGSIVIPRAAGGLAAFLMPD